MTELLADVLAAIDEIIVGVALVMTRMELFWFDLIVLKLSYEAILLWLKKGFVFVFPALFF